jgi:hypothetical protein
VTLEVAFGHWFNGWWTKLHYLNYAAFPVYRETERFRPFSVAAGLPEVQCPNFMSQVVAAQYG